MSWGKHMQVSHSKNEFYSDEDAGGFVGIVPGSDTARAIEALAKCQFYPGSNTRQFVQSMTRKIGVDHARITKKMVYSIWKLVWASRKQLKARDLIERAMKVVNADNVQACEMLLFCEDCDE